MWKVKLASVIKSLVFLSSFLFISYKFFVIKNILCFDENQERVEEVCEHFSFVLKKPLFFRNYDQELLGYEVVIGEENTQSYAVSLVEKKLPSTLEIVVEKQEPAYRLIEFDKDIYLVSQHKNLLSNQQDLLLPAVELEVDQELDRQIHDFVIELVQSLEKYNLAFESLIIKEHNQLELKLIDGPRVLLESSQMPNQISWKIFTILSEQQVIEIELPIKEIDLRFNLPVIKT
jgi:hypothetical protein